MKLDDWAVKCWELIPLAKTTRKSYINRYKGQLSPAFGQYELKDLTTEHVQLWVLDVKPSIAKNYLPVLRTLYREAIKYNMATVNPVIGVMIPKHTPKETNFVPWETLKDLDLGRYTELARFMALHGLRYSEALAITEEDIHDGFVHINKSIHGNTTKSGKTRKVPYLGHYERFPRSYKWFLKACRAHGFGPHGLRYTYAHLCKTRGIGPQVAQRLLGHASITLTMDLYTKVLDDELETAAESLKGLAA